MRYPNLKYSTLLAVALLALLAAAPAFAQLQTGNLYGEAKDQSGAALPAVTVTLTGVGAPQVQVTNAQGQFRFLGLAPGSYRLQAELQGFSTVEYPNIVINVGRNANIELTLQSAIETTITVTTESPLLDERRFGPGASVAQNELEKIPTARDPWAILQTVPGVLTDRINVGGNESGQQSQYVGTGSTGDQAVWSLDGVVLTDMAALGSSPAYYDFEAFEEMQVTTGGSDSTIATGGVVLNMVTKRGTNEWRASGRRYETDRDGAFGVLPEQADLELDDSELAVAGPWRTAPGTTAPQASFTQGNQIDFVHDYGVEAGGPIVKDRLWAWGSYGRQKIQLRTISDVVDFTDLKGVNAKLNAQITAGNSASGFYFDSDKVKIGRNAGPTRPQETTWDQGKFGPKPTTYKVEDTHIFSSSFYLTGMYSKVNGGFELVPQGSLALTPTRDDGGVWHNSFLLNQTERPQTQYKADASSFFNTGGLAHELKFGAGYRSAEVSSVTQWGGQGYVLDGPTTFGVPGLPNYFGAARNGRATVESTYESAYVQDTLTVGNVTANVGLRYDQQSGKNHASSAPANANFPTVLPAVSYAGGDSGFTWTDITPRLGITYALGAERKTLLRASYSRFADQLGSGTANFTNPLRTPGYAYFFVTQPVGEGNDGNVTPDEILFSNGLSANVDPVTHGLLNSNGVDPELEAQISDEVLLGVEHALMPEFVLGLNLTYRRISNIIENELLVFDGDTTLCQETGDPLACPAFQAANLGSLGRQHRRSDYIARTFNQPLPDGSTRAITWYELGPGVSTRGGGFLTNGDREQEYKGAALTFNKRLANRWMMRGNFTFADWTWSQVPESELENPTEILAGTAGGAHEGDAVLQGSGTGSGSKGGIYINSKWSYSVNGLYQIAPERPWGFNVAANLTGREGYPVPYWRLRGGSLNEEANMNFGQQSVAVTSDPDEVRFDDVHMVDARVEKELAFADFGLTLGVDVFNLFNESYVLQRNNRLGQSTSDNVREITSPRIFRLGARFSFR